MNAQDFDAWVDSTTQRIEADRGTPTTMTIVLVERLKSGTFTTDWAILTSVKTWITHDQRLKEYLGDNHPGPVYAQSLAYLDGLLLYMYGRPELEAQLWERKAFLYRKEGQGIEEITASRNALKILDPNNVKTDQLRLDLKVQMAKALSQQGQQLAAEEIYLEVLAYDWTAVSNLPEARNLMRESYVSAGLGLIDCRKNNLNRLQQISFIDEVRDRLQPALETAIAKAKQP